MTEDETPEEGQPPVTNVVDLNKFKEDRKSGSVEVGGGTVLGSPPKAQGFPQARPTSQRKYIISLKDDVDIEIEGFVGLTASFLAIGDEEGRIKFGAAAGEWLFVTDITDSKFQLSDVVLGPDDNDKTPAA